MQETMQIGSVPLSETIDKIEYAVGSAGGPMRKIAGRGQAHAEK